MRGDIILILVYYLQKIDNLYFYDINLGIIGIKDNNKAITEIFFSKDRIGDDIKETDLIKISLKTCGKLLRNSRLYKKE